MADTNDSDTKTDDERRFEETLMRMLRTPPKPHKKQKQDKKDTQQKGD